MPPERLSATFSALADPTRRAILARLASGEASVTELAGPFAMSLPAVSKHLKVLEHAGLVSRVRDAQSRPRRLDGAPLREVAEGLEAHRRSWGEDSRRSDERPRGTPAEGDRTTAGGEKKGEAMKVQPYLFFEGRCEEALGFYRGALGAEVTALMRFRECPDPLPPGMLPPGGEDKVMHAAFRIGGATVMASDGRCSGQARFGGVSLSVSVPDEATADRFFAALAEGGQVQMPLGKTFFSPRFGVVADRFGVSWMIVVEA